MDCHSDDEPEGEELKEWRPSTQGQAAPAEDPPGSAGQEGQGAQLQGAGSLGPSEAYELEPFRPSPRGASEAVMQQAHHVGPLQDLHLTQVRDVRGSGTPGASCSTQQQLCHGESS